MVGAPVWQLQAQVLPAGFLDLAVRIVAGGAVEAVGAANLVRAGDLLELLHVAVAPVADSRRHCAQVLRSAAERRQILRRADVSLAAGGIARRSAAWNDAWVTTDRREPVDRRRLLPAGWWPAFPAGRCSGRDGNRRR